MSTRDDQYPLITVVVPAYNSDRYIADCLESISHQVGAFRTEIIVVDDGSTDETRERVQEFGGVRLLTQPNSGPSAARNRGIKAAKGGYIAFLDSDDLWPEGKLSAQMEIFDQNPEVGLVFGDCKLFSDKGSRDLSMFEESGLDEVFWGDREIVKDAYQKLFLRNYIPTGSAIIRTECLREVGAFDEGLRFVEDLDMWLRLAMRFPLAYTSKLCELKRQHCDNVSNDAEAMMRGYLDVVDKHRHHFPDAIRNHGIRLRPLIAFEYCLLGDFLEHAGRMREARSYYLQAFRQQPAVRPIYYWLHSFLPRANDAPA